MEIRPATKDSTATIEFSAEDEARIREMSACISRGFMGYGLDASEKEKGESVPEFEAASPDSTPQD
ncbi:MAG: hypothetical protein AB1646_25425 [Thermodesulfobacteriota bacterium]